MPGIFGFYLRPSYCSLAHMQSPVSGLASLIIKLPRAGETHQGHLRRFDEAFVRFVDGNFNCHFLEVCYGAQAISASASHEISHLRTRYSALSVRLSFSLETGFLCGSTLLATVSFPFVQVLDFASSNSVISNSSLSPTQTISPSLYQTPAIST